MNRQSICFDFDYTLAIEEVSGGWIAVGTGVLKPIQKIIDMVFEKDEEGFDCHIVTFRKNEDIPEVEEFVKKHNLPIKGIHSTSGLSKIPLLKKLNCTLMVDDQVEVCTACIMNDIPCLLVDHGFSGTNNCVADRLDKIKV
jgi:ATP-dependent RNA circularization protein (DNA/RNA ligase family)